MCGYNRAGKDMVRRGKVIWVWKAGENQSVIRQGKVYEGTVKKGLDMAWTG